MRQAMAHRRQAAFRSARFRRGFGWLDLYGKGSRACSPRTTIRYRRIRLRWQLHLSFQRLGCALAAASFMADGAARR
jgi:hypothetical protein